MMSSAQATTSYWQRRHPLDLIRDPDEEEDPYAQYIKPFITIYVEKPELQLIGSTQVAIYDVITTTNYEGFNPRTGVWRRYSDFQLLRKTLVAKGAKLSSLSWFESIPKNYSRWEELNDWVEQLEDVSYLLNKDCLDELRRFLTDKSPYQEPRTTSFIHRLFR